MSNGPRGASGRSGGLGDDPTLPEIQRDSTAQVLVAEHLEASDELIDLDESSEPESLGVRLDAWRRHYLPLPDEVVTEFLGEDEYVVHTDHPSFRAFLIKNAIQVAVLGVVGLAFLIFVRGGFDWWTVLIFLLLQLVLAALALQRLSDRYTSYVITNLRLIRLSGVFGRKLASIPWTRMTGLGYRQRPMGRILGYATIFIESANEESGLREFSDINDPAAFHQKILDMVSAKSGQSTKDQAPPATRGVRKSFKQRRRERRAMSIARARRAAQGAGKAPAKSEPISEPAPAPDTAGVYEALSTTDGETRQPGGQPISGRGPTQRKPRGGSRPAPPPTRPGTPPPTAGRRPGAARGDVKPPTPGGRSISEPPASGPDATPGDIGSTGGRGPGAAGATGATGATDRTAGGRGRSKRLWPGTSSKPRGGRPVGPPGPTRPVRPPKVAPTPKAPPPVTPTDEGQPVETQPPRRSRGGWIWARRQPSTRRSSGESTMSARDALGSIRQGQRPARPVRRVRLPTFARRARPTFPESRQLPAAREDRPDEPGSEPEPPSESDE
ncbi:MAG: PH domain-containing protein [Acidimicrobiales bacterium]